jgi:superfamily II DNA or RNA helicase
LLNPEQQAAVQAVVGGDHAPLPFIIYGPPGTGKTSTLIEVAVLVSGRGGGPGGQALCRWTGEVHSPHMTILAIMV